MSSGDPITEQLSRMRSIPDKHASAHIPQVRRNSIHYHCLVAGSIEQWYMLQRSICYTVHEWHCRLRLAQPSSASRSRNAAHTVLKTLLTLPALKMAPKIRKDNTKNEEGKVFESVLIVCPRCKEVKEIVRAKRGKLQFVEYYCCPGKALEIHSVTIKPN